MVKEIFFKSFEKKTRVHCDACLLQIKHKSKASVKAQIEHFRCMFSLCEVQRGVIQTMERWDAISPSHINSLGEGAVREGTVCLCLPLERAVFLMEPEIHRGRERVGKESEIEPTMQSEWQANTMHTMHIVYRSDISISISEVMSRALLSCLAFWFKGNLYGVWASSSEFKLNNHSWLNQDWKEWDYRGSLITTKQTFSILVLPRLAHWWWHSTR